MSVLPFGVILAGGLATRMGGGDKCLLPLCGVVLLDQVLARLEGQVAGLVLNANGDPARFADWDVPVVADGVDGHPGPLAGVLAGMEYAAARGHETVLSVAGDTPFFPRDLGVRLEAARAGAGLPLAMAVTPSEERAFNRQPTFGLWPVSLRGDLRAALEGGVRKIVAFTEPLGCAREMFAETPDPFFNINTPEDLAEAARRAC